MTSPLIHLGVLDLVIATSLVLAAGVISVALRLGIGARLAWAATRSAVQLGLIGVILKRIFALDSAWLVVLLVTVMVTLAAREAVRRSQRKYPAIYLDAVLAMAVSSLVVGGIVTQLVIGVEPWYAPQYVIPLIGMILGNSLTGISLCLDRFLEHLASRRAEVELALAFGATRSEALAPALKAAVRTGMVPIINSMSAAGIVSLPGMMTGQILAGAQPMEAVAYQIVVMFMIAAAAALGSMLVAITASRRLATPDGRLRLGG